MEDVTKKLYNTIERISAIETDNHNLHCRLNEVIKKVDNLSDITESVHTLANEVVHMREDINRVDSRLLEVETKPSKRWEKSSGITLQSGLCEARSERAILKMCETNSEQT